MPRTIPSLTLLLSVAFAAPNTTVPEMRLNPSEVTTAATRATGNQIGSSKLPGVQTTILSGDPSKATYYAVLLYVPAHTVIQAHLHRDNRIATVLSGSWNFGYGSTFDAARLKHLPAGSVYSEPAGTNHFARTDNSPAIVQISGVGPTDTVYFDPANDPSNKRK